MRAAEEIRSDALQSPDDPEATFHRKDETEYQGYVLHVAETADPENDLQLVVDVAVAPNNHSDSHILHERLPEMHRKTPDLRELHTDAGYGSEANDRLEEELGIAAVQTAIRGRVAQAPMHIERDAAGQLQIRCAAGHQVTGDVAKIHYKAAFPAASCAGCPFAAVCLAKPTRKGRTFYFTEPDVVKQARHHRIETLPVERRSLRANVEATVKEFKAPCRNGKLRRRGRYSMTEYGFLRAIGINFGRIYRHLSRLSREPDAPAPMPTPANRPAAVPRGVLAPLQRLIRSLGAVQWPSNHRFRGGHGMRLAASA